MKSIDMCLYIYGGILKMTGILEEKLAEKSNFKYFPIIEINKRSFDGQYNVWAYIKKSDRLNIDGLGTPLKSFHLNEGIINNALGGRWVLIDVHKNKKTATEALKKKYGKNCFKDDNTTARVSYV